jgi:hypothetical protein
MTTKRSNYANIVHMTTFSTTVRFIRTNLSVSLMFLIYVLLWWAPLRPIVTIATGRGDIPFGINGPLEWMSRWWLTPDSPTLFQPIALFGAWWLAAQRVHMIRGTWARTCRSAARRGAKWASYSWIPLGLLLITGTVSFLGHITPLAITTLVWLPIGVVFYIYGPRVIRSLHTPALLLIAASAVPDTIPELVEKVTQRILGAVAVQLGKVLGDTLIYDSGSAFNVADDYLRNGSLNAPISAPMNGLALMTSTIVVGAIWTLHKRRGIASTALSKLIGIAVSGTCVLVHTGLIVLTLHNGHRGYWIASLHNILLLPLTAIVTIFILKKCFASPLGNNLRTMDRKVVLWFLGLPDIRRKNLAQRRNKPQKSSKPAPPMIGVLLRMVTSPFRVYWRLMTRIDTNISKWEKEASRNKRPRG